MFTKNAPKRLASRAAFSLIELIVSLAIISILIAIIVPAVQSARETARRTQCTNNLKQIALAILSFEGTHQHFPNADGLERDTIGNWIVDVLPYLEQAAFCDELIRVEAGFGMTDDYSKWPELRASLLKVSPPGFHCPSDTISLPGGNSYPGNAGIWRPLYGQDGIFKEREETSRTEVPSNNAVRTADITDGLSNTIMVSEWLRGNPQGANETNVEGWDEPRRYTWFLPINIGSGADLRFVVKECTSVPPTNPRRYQWKSDTQGLGVPWFYVPLGFSTYNHAMTPNTASCRPWASIWGLRGGMYTTGSLHGKGVNAVFADGHVKFMSNEVDQTIWRDFGSRNSDSEFSNL